MKADYWPKKCSVYLKLCRGRKLYNYIQIFVGKRPFGGGSGVEKKAKTDQTPNYENCNARK